MMQVELEAGDGQIEYNRQELKLTYFPPSAGDVSPTSIRIMDKGENRRAVSSKCFHVFDFEFLISHDSLHLTCASTRLAL